MKVSVNGKEHDTKTLPKWARHYINSLRSRLSPTRQQQIAQMTPRDHTCFDIREIFHAQ